MIRALLVLVLLAGTASGQVLLNFTSSYCPPCVAMRPTLDQLRAEGFEVVDVNINTAPDSARRWNVNATPTFVATYDGKREIARTTGRQPLDGLRNLFGGLRPMQRETFRDPDGRGTFTPVTAKPSGACKIMIGRASVSGSLMSKGPTWGVVWTCAHHIKGTTHRTTIEFPETGEKLPATLISHHRATDNALYQTEGRPRASVVSLGPPPEPGTSICYGGFGPKGKWQAFQGVYLGRVQRRGTDGGLMDGGVRWQGSSRPGDSGGPSWVPNGQVFSLVTASADGETVGPNVEQLCQMIASSTGSMPWNADLVQQKKEPKPETETPLPLPLPSIERPPELPAAYVLYGIMVPVAEVR